MTNKYKKGNLRVWWIPQVSGKPFLVPIETFKEGARIMDILANYDIFQFDNNIKPDYSNTGGIEAFDGKEWTDADII